MMRKTREICQYMSWSNWSNGKNNKEKFLFKSSVSLISGYLQTIVRTIIVIHI